MTDHIKALAHVQRRLACNKPTAIKIVKELGETVLEFDDPQSLANAYAEKVAKPIEPDKPIVPDPPPLAKRHKDQSITSKP